MIGLYTGNWGMSPSQWGSVVSPSQKGQIAMVSRTQSQATNQPVTPVTAAPSVSREQPSSISLLDMARRKGADPVEMAVRGRIQYLTPEEVDQQVEQAKSAQEVMEEGQCQTCKERKYQDGSNDPGVSFKTPTNIAPEQAASAVRGHEQEHVVREQAKAQRENREIVSQSVTYHTAICPECGKVYISGGTTRTSSRAVEEQPTMESGNPNTQAPFSAVA